MQQQRSRKYQADHYQRTDKNPSSNLLPLRGRRLQHGLLAGPVALRLRYYSCCYLNDYFSSGQQLQSSWVTAAKPS